MKFLFSLGSPVYQRTSYKKLYEKIRQSSKRAITGPLVVTSNKESFIPGVNHLIQKSIKIPKDNLNYESTPFSNHSSSTTAETLFSGTVEQSNLNCA